MLWGRVHVALMAMLVGLATARILGVLTQGEPLGQLAFPAVVLLLVLGLAASWLAHLRQVVDRADDLLGEILARTDKS